MAQRPVRAVGTLSDFQVLRGKTSALRTGWGLLNATPREAICSYRSSYCLGIRPDYGPNAAIWGQSAQAGMAFVNKAAGRADACLSGLACRKSGPAGLHHKPGPPHALCHWRLQELPGMRKNRGTGIMPPILRIGRNIRSGEPGLITPRAARGKVSITGLPGPDRSGARKIEMRGPRHIRMIGFRPWR